MNTFRQRFLILSVATALAGVSGVRSARACTSSQGLTYYGGYIVQPDTPQNIWIVPWGYDIYGDPQVFSAAVQSIFGVTWGVGGTRFFGVNTQYSGLDWDTFANGSVVNHPNNFLGLSYDDSFLPAPINGVIYPTNAQIQSEIDNVLLLNGLTAQFGYDVMVVILLPPNAVPPVAACGQHYTTPSGQGVGAWVAYPFSSVCGGSIAYQEHALLHEVSEATVNPAWNYGASYEGWDQGTGAGCETGDICNSNQFQIQTKRASDVFSQVTTQQFVSNEAVAAGADACVYGRSVSAEILGLEADNSLWDAHVDANTSLSINAASSWGKPSGVTLTGSPAATSWAQDRVDGFVRGTNGKMYHAWSENGAVTWETLTSSKSFTQSPDAVTWGIGNLQVFGVQGTTIVKNTQDQGSSWSGWKTVAGPSGVTPSSKVTVASWGASAINFQFPYTNQTIVAAFRGSDGKVWLGNSSQGGAFTWSRFSAPASLTGDIDISASAPPHLDLFVLDTSGNYWDMYSNDGVTIAGSAKWAHPSQGRFQTGPGVAGLGDSRFIVGGRVGTNTSYVEFWDWHGSSWVSVGSPFVSGIDIASP